MARYRFKNLPTTATAISRKIQRIIPQDSQVRFPRAVSQASSPTPAERKSFQIREKSAGPERKSQPYVSHEGPRRLLGQRV